MNKNYNYINWYNDEDLAIFFDKYPKIEVLYPNINKNSSIENINDIKKLPFLLSDTLEVLLEDFTKEDEYFFKIEKNYKWDGATIPGIFWQFIGSKENNSFLVASLIHDYLCQNHNVINNDRYFSSKVFERLLYISGVNPFKRWLMFHSVDNFQKFQKW